MSAWTDAHAHLQDNFLEDPERGTLDLQANLDAALAANVRRVIVVGTQLGTSVGALQVSEFQHEVELYATVGMHPHDSLNDVNEIVELARKGHPKLVGIGECGLDYYYEHSPREAQLKSFAVQIALAKELNLALVIHARDAFADLFDVLKGEGVPERTVIHCFTGNAEDAKGCLNLGCDISLSGIVTFKNAEELREAAKLVPLDRLHVETDSPFLAPLPHRGKPNEPAFVSLVGAFVAELRGEDREVLQNATSANTARLFNLPELIQAS